MKVRPYIYAPITDAGEEIAFKSHVIEDGPRWLSDGPENPAFDEFGVMRRWGRGVDDGGAVLWKLHNVSVQRTVKGQARYQILLDDGVCAAESYHDGWWIDRHTLSKGITPTMDDVSIGAVVDEPHVLLSGMWDNNYAHFIHETLSKWWCAEHWPEGAPRILEMSRGYQHELMGIFHPGERFVSMPAERTLYRTLYVPSPRARWCVGRGQVEFLKQSLAIDHRGSGVGHIYISRSDAQERRVLNEAELLRDMMPKHRPLCITLSPHSVTRQISIFKEATGSIIMPHGAGCANLLWARPGTRVLELVPKSYQHPMWGLWAEWLGLDYRRVVCLDRAYGKDMVADPKAVLEAVL